MGRDKASEKTYSNIRIGFVTPSFSVTMMFRISTASKQSNAIMPKIMQNGINLGYCLTTNAPSNEIARARLKRFKRHSMPNPRKAELVNIEKGRKTNAVFFITRRLF